MVYTQNYVILDWNATTKTDKLLILLVGVQLDLKQIKQVFSICIFFNYK